MKRCKDEPAEMADRLSDDDDWRLPVGETLDERRARLILARFGPEARRISQDLAARLRVERPGGRVEGKVYELATLLHAYRHPRSADLAGIGLGFVAYEPSGGGIMTIPIVLAWNSGRVAAKE
jgi:hypothetical protein